MMQFDFRNEIDDKRAVRAQRLLKAVLPSRKLRLALSQYRADETLKGLRQGGIRNVRAYTGRTCRTRTGHEARRAPYATRFTTEDLPMPEYPDTRTSSLVPCATTRS